MVSSSSKVNNMASSVCGRHAQVTHFMLFSVNVRKLFQISLRNTDKINIQLHACGSWHCCVNVRPKSPPATWYSVKGAHLHVPHHASLLASLLWRGTCSPYSRSFSESSMDGSSKHGTFIKQVQQHINI